MISDLKLYLPLEAYWSKLHSSMDDNMRHRHRMLDLSASPVRCGSFTLGARTLLGAPGIATRNKDATDTCVSD